jgi:hypothetical protein
VTANEVATDHDDVRNCTVEQEADDNANQNRVQEYTMVDVVGILRERGVVNQLVVPANKTHNRRTARG